MAEVVGAGEGLWYRNLLSYISLQPRCCCTTPHLNNFVNVHFLFCILLCIALLAWPSKLFVFTLSSFRQILYFEYSTPNVECCTKA